MASRIDWNYPQPKNGFDKFVGPGATRAEVVWQFAASGLFALAVLLLGWMFDYGWSTLQFIIAGLIAADMAGGVATNATSSAKRWYHRAGQGFGVHMGFIALHLIQIVLVAWAFLDFSLPFVLFTYGYLLAASVILLRTPHYLQRSVALILVAFGLLLNQYAIPTAPGVEWFVPVLYLKLLVSHLLKEEPYYPAPRETTV